MQENQKIAKSASIVGIGTLMSRIGGLLRDQVTAYYFGASTIADAFFVAWRLPNLLRRLLAEGAFTASFVPIFTSTLKKNDLKEAENFFKNLFSLMLVILTVVTLIGVIFAPQIVMLMAPGYANNPDLFTLTVLLARVLFPFIFLMGLTSLFVGALNSLGHFAIPAIGPLAVNICMILASVFLSSFVDPPILALAIGAILGGVLQLLIQIPPLIKAGKFLGFNFNLKNKLVKKFFVLMGPAALGAAVYQLSVFINTLLASYLPTGSISWLYYADRLLQFPLGIFSIALSTAVLPSLSRQSSAKDFGAFNDTLKYSLGLQFFITLPATIGLIVLAKPLVYLFFQRGMFNIESAENTCRALWVMALSLPFLSGAGLLARAFYSLSNTKTPAMIAVVSLIINTFLAVCLMGPLKHIGLALASALVSVINFVWLYYLIVKKEKKLAWKSTVIDFFKYLSWALCMGLVIWPFGGISPMIELNNSTMLLLSTFGAIILGMVVYFFLALCFKCPYLNFIKNRFLRK